MHSWFINNCTAKENLKGKGQEFCWQNLTDPRLLNSRMAREEMFLIFLPNDNIGEINSKKGRNHIK